MRKFLTTALAALTAATAVAATAAPAEARDRYGRHYRHHHYDRGSDKAAIAAVAGIAGLAIGAAIAGNDNRGPRYSSGGQYSSNGYRYDPRYDGYSGDYYGRTYDRDRVCITRERVYDPYIGRRVTIERRYAC